MHVRAWIRRCSVLVLGLGAVPAALAQAPGVKLQRAGLELGYRAPQIVERMALAPGSEVAAFGLSDTRLLRELLGALGENGRVHTVSRNEQNYRGAEALASGDYGRRLDPIFAADGDAHLDADQVVAAIVIDTEGFVFLHPEELFRQLRKIVQPGGKLIMLRLPLRTSSSGRIRPGDRSQTKEEPSPGPTEAERLRLERDGFVLVEAPEILQYREMWILQRSAD